MAKLVSITLAGAYGEHYSDKESILTSLNNGCDFRIISTYPESRDIGRVTSIRDLGDIPEVRVRYRNGTLCQYIKIRRAPLGNARKNDNPHANGWRASIA